MTEWKQPWDGGCRCGRVRLRVSAPPLLTMACHCVGCQRMSASAFSLSAAIPSVGLSLVLGEPTIGGLHGSARHFFCPWCMSWLFTRPEGIDAFVNLRPTMLDDPSWFAPFIETMTSEKLAWAMTPAVHSFDRWPPLEAYQALIKGYAEHTQKALPGR